MSNMPIISPWLFYWIDVVNWAQGISLFLAIAGFFAAILFAIGYFCNVGYASCKRECEICSFWLKVCIPLTIVFALIAIFTPSKDTLIYMQTAKLITTENLEWTAESVKQVFDYVVNAISGK